MIQEYQDCLSKIRSHLATSGRNRATLEECDTLLQDAKRYATAMIGLAEIENDTLKLHTARQLMERDIQPLTKEVKRTLESLVGRDTLFSNQQQQQYRPPDMEDGNMMMESLITSSDDLLRESQSVLMETEHIANQTLWQMGQQREQIQNATSHLQTVQTTALTAARILASLSKKALKNRLSLYGIIITLGLLNLFVLYRIYKKHYPHHTADNHNTNEYY